MLFAYLGSDRRSYGDYLDAAAGRMLQASPGGVYDVQVAPGRVAGLPLPPGDGRWAPAAPVPDGPVAAAALIAAAGADEARGEYAGAALELAEAARAVQDIPQPGAAPPGGSSPGTPAPQDQAAPQGTPSTDEEAS